MPYSHAQPSVSVIVPTLNEAPQAGALRDHLALLQRSGWEIIIADGGSCDGTPAMFGEGVKVLSAPRGRARQMNAGAAVASGRWLLFLHADTHLPPQAESWLHTVVSSSERSWGFFPVRLSGRRRPLRLIERAMNWRSRLSQIATGDQAIFVERSLFEKLGGFAPIALMEDIEFCGRMRRWGRPLVARQPVQTSSRRWEENGICRTVLTMWTLRAAYACGASPRRLARYYYPGDGH